ncbi:hypothetical protein GN958_ATG01944 [Phytophthora infestans]|uniref:CCHC-type domain-containing protein n=1 Tax=Phytophthora infestans TaxID=4787 RepID=A0A8S9V7A6_PHYIN|nr:hypothetical protein GN958_ATG01944 [Phytophthora infestans]
MERYQARQTPAQRAPCVLRPGTECFYCGREGHFTRDYRLKQADLAAEKLSEEQGRFEAARIAFEETRVGEGHPRAAAVRGGVCKSLGRQ